MNPDQSCDHKELIPQVGVGHSLGHSLSMSIDRALTSRPDRQAVTTVTISNGLHFAGKAGDFRFQPTPIN